MPILLCCLGKVLLHQYKDTGIDAEALCVVHGSFDNVALSRGLLVTTRILDIDDENIVEVWSLAKPHQLVYRLDSIGEVAGIVVRQIGDGPDFQSLNQVFCDDVIQKVFILSMGTL